jgi:hypothetical protein
LPGLAHHFGILPWMVDDLTPAEAHGFVESVKAATKK